MARYQGSGINSYPEYAQASTGGPSYPPFAVVNEAYNQQTPNTALQLGDQIVDKFGNIYLYVRALEALAAGQVVRYSKPGDSTAAHPAAGTVAAATTVALIKTTITTVADEAGLGSFLASPGKTDGTGTPFLRRIKKQVAVGATSQFYISLPQIFFGIGGNDGDVLAAIPQTGDAVAIIKPYTVVVNGTTVAYGEEGPVGVALGTVTAGSSTLVMSQGIAQVQAGGSGGSYFAVVLGSYVFCAAAGIVTGPNGTETAELAFQQIPSAVGVALMAYAGASAMLLPVRVQCLKNA